MPLVDVTHRPHLHAATLDRLADALPHLVSVAVACPEEPYDGDLQPGDVELRFRALGPLDRSGLDIVVEVRSKWFESRAADRQQRADSLQAALTAATGLDSVGVHLSLPVAAWSQGD